VQHEGFAILALERVDDLLVLAGAERGDDQRLGLAAGEQRGAVGARQDADLGDDRTTVLVSRPSMRLPVSRMALRTTSASRLPNASPKAASSASLPSNSFLASSFTALILAWRACLTVSA
jgi:hypothetical protein